MIAKESGTKAPMIPVEDEYKSTGGSGLGAYIEYQNGSSTDNSTSDCTATTTQETHIHVRLGCYTINEAQLVLIENVTS